MLPFEYDGFRVLIEDNSYACLTKDNEFGKKLVWTDDYKSEMKVLLNNMK
jgi:hypothetical protein